MQTGDTRTGVFSHLGSGPDGFRSSGPGPSALQVQAGILDLVATPANEHLGFETSGTQKSGEVGWMKKCHEH